ncbi:hypothetical protein K8Z61_16290 [Nocardioides sp. TRM66260-LWL]|uniref:EsaB/YukD family protein n=1 Tax=Nocardioides sp. TRM66260-LWL TaxID=2874478 RepID=UPI001CC5FB9D|nr:EsaB/YukD family protein [Nocardioides sp. TRM66260-LWL]MBZ5736055.1 hypothetical protein [Nocardioides sp. TRM66260-LWL]
MSALAGLWEESRSRVLPVSIVAGAVRADLELDAELPVGELLVELLERLDCAVPIEDARLLPAIGGALREDAGLRDQGVLPGAVLSLVGSAEASPRLRRPLDPVASIGLVVDRLEPPWSARATRSALLATAVLAATAALAATYAARATADVDAAAGVALAGLGAGGLVALLLGRRLPGGAGRIDGPVTRGVAGGLLVAGVAVALGHALGAIRSAPPATTAAVLVGLALACGLGETGLGARLVRLLDADPTVDPTAAVEGMRGLLASAATAQAAVVVVSAPPIVVGGGGPGLLLAGCAAVVLCGRAASGGGRSLEAIRASSSLLVAVAATTSWAASRPAGSLASTLGVLALGTGLLAAGDPLGARRRIRRAGLVATVAIAPLVVLTVVTVLTSPTGAGPR